MHAGGAVAEITAAIANSDEIQRDNLEDTHCLNELEDLNDKTAKSISSSPSPETTLECNPMLVDESINTTAPVAVKTEVDDHTDTAASTDGEHVACLGQAIFPSSSSTSDYKSTKITPEVNSTPPLF